MRGTHNIWKNIDWITVFLYLCLIIAGWLNIYAAVFDEDHTSILDFSQKYGKQLVWIGASIILAIGILLIDSKFFTAFAIPIYIFTISLLVFVLLFGREVNGARSWFELGSIRIQPAEFAKYATCLAIASVMSRNNFRLKKFSNLLLVGIILLTPACLIILQNDTGSALVYSSFVFVMYREGMHGSILLLGLLAIVLFIISLLFSATTVFTVIFIACLFMLFFYCQNHPFTYRLFLIFSALFGVAYGISYFAKLDIPVHYLLLGSFAVPTILGLIHVLKERMRHVATILFIAWCSLGFSMSVTYAFDHLKPHQQDRINDLLGITSDPTGAGYNVNQSKIAIGSGGFTGKGYLQGTQTKFNFVPEQSTDFIFCTVGEEWGFVGSSVVIIMLMTFILRIVYLAERQRSDFSRIYGYSVASILFFHLAINVGMTIGIMPVIGIPLPFFSYGGSSLWAFTILVFIFLRLDANRLQVFR